MSLELEFHDLSFFQFSIKPDRVYVGKIPGV